MPSQKQVAASAWRPTRIGMARIIQQLKPRSGRKIRRFLHPRCDISSSHSTRAWLLTRRYISQKSLFYKISQGVVLPQQPTHPLNGKGLQQWQPIKGLAQ
jgi:hypothetical protein